MKDGQYLLSTSQVNGAERVMNTFEDSTTAFAQWIQISMALRYLRKHPKATVLGA